ncbi:recombination protein RecT [Actinomadura sp. KC06]|uniref:recombination protein RecT n=1 Tax=Actinomadura sp. KC06 TaxID=2530369 RepID=UPI00105042B6|nr:recombination protein RecT [Actinomadura sp. KC06]TDD37822.1 recombination protein RecT [Actinomadura sp. KC06]
MGRDLAQRAAAQRGGNQNGNGDAPAKQLTLAQQINQMQKQYQLAMPKGAEAGQLVRDALTCIRTTKNLAECEAASVLGGLMTCAQLGLRPGVGSLGHAWLIPFWDRNAGPVNERTKQPMGGYRAQLIIGYQGYAELCYRSGRVLNIAPRTVFTNDHYELEYGLDGDKLIHRPNIDGTRGEPRLYYAVARLERGGYGVTDPVTVADMEKHRDKHAMAKTKNGDVVGPWKDHFEAMAHKTMVRRLVKLLPKSTDLAVAMSVDEGLRLDVSPDIDPAEVTSAIPGEVDGGDQATLAAADAEAAAQAAAEAGGGSSE